MFIIMKVSAVSFTSVAGSTTSKKSTQPSIQPCVNSYNKASDILPVTVGLGAGLMLAYALKSGKLESAGKKIKNFISIA